MNFLFTLCHRDREFSWQIVEDIDNGGARQFERVGYSPRVDVTDEVRARELCRIAWIDTFLLAVAE